MREALNILERSAVLSKDDENDDNSINNRNNGKNDNNNVGRGGVGYYHHPGISSLESTRDVRGGIGRTMHIGGDIVRAGE